MSCTACAYPWQEMNIDLTGEVVPCCFWSGYGNSGKPLGNTNQQSLEEIWNGEAYQELRRVNASGELAEGHPCHECLGWQWAGQVYPKFDWPVSFERETGQAFSLIIPEHFRKAVAALDEPVLMYEDGVPMPHPDAIHDEIRQLGEGRYSVWNDTLFFSSADNSDARSNGRDYELRCGPHVFRLANFKPDCTSGHNMITAQQEYERGATVMTAHPTMISFIATSDCNIDCPACSQNTVRLLKVQHRERTERDVVALVPYLTQLIWHGGEPYLIKRFREFVDGFRTEDNPNLTFGFTSNGTLLNAAELEKLDKFPHINASVSIDSFVRETFDVIRAGANYDTVLANVLAAVERYEEPDFLIHVGMIITKLNFAELPHNLAFAMQHGIGLNLSPVLVYPVTERLDVFEDFAAQTRGWSEAIEQSMAVLEDARAKGLPAIRRIDPSGHVAALENVLEQARARHAELFELQVTVEDPDSSLPKMRDPGLIVALDGGQAHPCAYLRICSGPGTYRLRLPRADLSGPRSLSWTLLHDLSEPMGLLDEEPFVDPEGRNLPEIGWAVMPGTLLIRMPPFEPVPRPRNATASNHGLPTPDGMHVIDPEKMLEAYQALVKNEADEGRGYVAVSHDPNFHVDFGNALRAQRYGAYHSLT